jgi:ribonucleotide monophosphatase NagD (HAD superfamily)
MLLSIRFIGSLAIDTFYWEFIQAMHLCGTTASETIYVGDNPNKDLLGARQLGMGTEIVENE